MILTCGRRPDTAAMLREDLAAARAAWLATFPEGEQRAEQAKTSFLLAADAAGNVIDFHALRHTCGSLLAASGVNPKVAQTIMRHSDINLTLSRYSHVYAGQEVAAVGGLPDLAAAPERRQAQATGTDDAQADDRTAPRSSGAPAGPDSRLALCLALQGTFRRATTHGDAQKSQGSDDAETTGNTRKTADFPGNPHDSHTASGRNRTDNHRFTKAEAHSTTTVKTTTCGDTSPRLGAPLGASAAELDPTAPDLAAVLSAWPTLPEPVKAGILAMVRVVGRAT